MSWSDTGGRLGIGADAESLHAAARAFLADRCPRAVPRALVEAAPEAPERLPPFWEEIAALGWLGIHLPEGLGGGGGGLADVAIVLEEMGRVVAPGPYWTTVLAGAVIHRLGTDEQQTGLLPELIEGNRPATVAIGAEPGDLSGRRLQGEWAVVPHAATPSAWVVLPARRDDRLVWCIVERSELEVTPRPGVDRTRSLAHVVAHDVTVDRQWVLEPPDTVADDTLADDVVLRLAVRLIGAEALGAAAWCVESATEHARVREQFGRPIGQFQAVKHRCADMLCGLEMARAAVWDALRADDLMADAAAGALAPEAVLRAAEGCVQVLGGMGFTWEHDAHLYLKRALGVRALLGAPARWRAAAVVAGRRGQRRRLVVDLPPAAEASRAPVRQFLATLRAQDRSQWRATMAEAGYLAPHWPAPWGRGATALEQLIIDEEFAKAEVQRPHLQVGAWVLPTLIAHGSPEQQKRWIPPTLRGEISWCQLFSEPSAGSDLAALATKASRVDGGWRLTGQKVWTTMAAQADLGLCVARTNPDVPKRDGISCFVVDMRSEGLDIRPLRELTGEALFNEVFLSEVFVPDDCLVGTVDQGWQVARSTLGNERVSMGSGTSFGLGEEALLALLDETSLSEDPVGVDEVGRLLVEAQALAVLGLRLTLRAVDGSATPGPEASVRKLLAAEHEQKVQEAGWALLGQHGAAKDGTAAPWVAGYLANRCLTIAGGTSEIQRNVIAERLLGLPRDP